MADRQRNRIRRRRATAVAWLATVAMLVNVLLPTALLFGAQQDGAPAAVAICGAAPHDPGRHGNPTLPAGHHCVCCVVAAAAPAPATAAQLLPPSFAGIAGPALPSGGPLPRRLRFAAALPRAPPAAA
jgi:hypothetical protein